MGADEARDGVVEAEFLFETAPFVSCHASTIAGTPRGLVAAWFGGTAEGRPDVGIWVARHRGGRWSEPTEVATGKHDQGERLPCWNPVLYQVEGGPLLLFYKVGPSPRRWWGMLRNSDDGGDTWSGPRRLPEGILGPIKNKPVRLADGALLCPASTEHDGWRVHLERTADRGATWTTIGPLGAGQDFDAIQPAILTHPRGVLQVVCRSRQGRIIQSWSRDGGASWGPLELSALPNPNSGIDAVTLRDGRHLLVYNHTGKGRSPLNVAVSDDGRTWKAGPALESGPGEYSYPAVIQDDDGRVHITYTWNRRRIKHVVLDPAPFVPRDLPAAPSPPPRT
jgi:predicted neuraminidase